MAIIAVENLTKRFSGNLVLDNLNFAVEKGDTLYIVGENGSGKTTLVKLLLGLMDASSGKIKSNRVYAATKRDSGGFSCKR